MLVIATFLAPLGILLNDSTYEREVGDRTASTRVGTAFSWPDDVHAADPDLALRILSEAADATGSNVIRVSVGTEDSGRTSITHYVYLVRDSSALFRAFRLADGRWLNRDETRSGSAIVSSAPVGKAHVVGRPSVLAGAYDVTFAPLRLAYEFLPTGGQYVIESRKRADTEQFLAIVWHRLTEAGMTGLTVGSLRPVNSAIDSGAQSANHLSLRFLPYTVVPVMSLLVLSILLREGKSIGVMRLSGHSTARIWFTLVGRLQLRSILVAVLGCTAVLILVPGVDTSFARAVAGALFKIALASLGITTVVGVVMVSRMHVGELIKGRVQ